MLSGRWLQSNAPRLPSVDSVFEALRAEGNQLTIQVDQVEYWDSTLPALIYALKNRCANASLDLDTSALTDDIAALLALIEEPLNHSLEQASPANIFEHVGEATLRQWFNLLAIGSTVYFFLRSAFHALTGRGQFRWRDFLGVFEHCTVNALPIVTIVSVLMGSILAFVGAIQLRAFGADIFIADTVGIAVLREMAAIITAIVMAGHTGAAFAANLASMQVNEEVDALRTMGLSPYDYLTVPRVLALAVALPLLYVYAAVITLFGSMLVANITLDLSPMAYISRTIDTVPLYYIGLGLIKSLCFGILIGLVSCHIGLQSGRSAEAVGQAATQAVVVSIVGIIAVDSLFAVASILFGF